MVTVIATEQIVSTKQWVYITLEVEGETVEHTTVQPWNTKDPVLSGKALSDWCQTQEDRYKIEVLKGMYPGAAPKGNTLKDMESCVKGTGKVKTQKVKWLNKHPKKVTLKQAIGAAKSINDIKNILLKMI